MNWDALDFAVFGALVGGVALVFTLATRVTRNHAYRYATGVALVAAFVLVWVNGAVGIIGNENNDANLMYFGVLAIGIIGALVARFRPRGMARTLFATALAQMLVAAIALFADLGPMGPTWPLDILILTLFFTALWLLSAWLFRVAARQQALEA